MRDVIDHLAMESFLRGLPPSAATWVRDQCEGYPVDVGDEAVHFFLLISGVLGRRRGYYTM